MLDEEKIKLMSKVTIYEEKERTKGLMLSKFYKEDYVKYGCLKTLISTTICYWLCVAVYVFINFEKVLNDLNDMDYFKVISHLVGGYIVAMLIFYLYGFVVYNYKYSKAKPHILEYNRSLKKLIKLYEKDDIRNDITRDKIKVYTQIGGDDEEISE